MNIKMKTVVWTLMFLIVGVLGWQWYQRHFPSWDEEVQLSDGRMIIVHRAHKFNTENALIETALTFDLPEMGGKQTWREFLYPAIVDVYEGKVYVVGSTTYKSASKYKYPKFGYVAFVYSASGWQRVPLIQLPEGIRKSENIAFCDTAGTRPTWRAKQTGWCGMDGQFANGASRDVDLIVREKNAKEMADLARTTTKSE